MFSKARRSVAVIAAAISLGIGGAAWASSAASAAPSAPAAIPKCASANLAVWVNLESAGVALGTVYYHLDFTNISGHTCHLLGYPGVSATNVSGRQLGRAAIEEAGVPAKIIDITPGGTVHAVLGYVDAALSPGCHPVTSGLLRVFPPNDTGARFAFFDVPVCTTAGTPDLIVMRVQAAV